jgi:uncharacterized membrane protein
MAEQQVVAPSQDDPVVAALSESVGGPLGRHARGGLRWWAPAGVLMLLAGVVLALGMVKDTTCYDATWSNSGTRYTHMCYSDLPYLYTARGFVEHEWPYSSDPQVRHRFPDVMEYPPGISYWAWGTSWVTHWVAGSPDLAQRMATPVDQLWGKPDVMREIRIFVVVNAIGFAAIAIISTGLLAKVVPRRPWDAAAFALSPALLLTGLVNWDMLAVVLVAGALYAWSRGRSAVTGLLIGLGTATKLYPLFLLGGILILCWRRQRWSQLATVVAAAAGAWVVANLPAYLSGPDQWKVFWHDNTDRAADLGSIWQAIELATGHTFDVHTINLWSWMIFGAWCVGVLLLGLRAPSHPRLAQLGFLIVAGFLLINKVYSPQYVLWLLPLAVLARPRWRDQLIWQGTEVVYFCSVWWYLAGDLSSASGDAPFYWAAIVLRMLGQLYLVTLVARDVLHPEHDPVRNVPEPPEVAFHTARSDFWPVHK